MDKPFISTILLIIMFAGFTIVTGCKQNTPGTSKTKENVITVGLKDADIIGSDNRAIQEAIDLVSKGGGGTVRILPGEYILNDAIRLRSDIRLTGEPGKTILKHAPLVICPLLKDADIGQKEVTPMDPSLFKVGMGIICMDNTKINNMVSEPLTIIKIENGVLYLNDYIEHDFTADKNSQGEGNFEGKVTNVFPLIHGYEIENVIIEGITIDSKVENDSDWKEIRTGGLLLDRTKNCVVKNCKSVNNYGDGFLVITSEHTTLEDCEGAYNSHHGIHPGSHSPWTIVRRCVMHHNGSDGLYICWGVRESEFTDNIIYQNGYRMNRNGISTGHKDTDNLIARNHVYENAKNGIHFRIKTEANGAHRTKVIDNIIENNGIPGNVQRGCGIFISGVTHDITIENNTIRETRSGDARMQKNAIRLEPGVTRVQMASNKISGHPETAILDNSKSPDNKLQVVANP
jgi:hypothetical protein